MLNLLHRLRDSEAGNIAIIAALALPVLVGITGIAIDYGAGINQSHKLQAVADSAALRAARELFLANATVATVTEVARRDAVWNLDVQSIGDPKTAKITVSVDSGAGTVQVDIKEDAVQFFTASLFQKMGPITVSSQARIYGGSNICLIGLDDVHQDTVILEDTAKVTAPSCGIYSNSRDSGGLNLVGSASMIADLICTVGGYSGRDSAFRPTPLTDCPVMPDPLAGHAPLTYGGCDFIDRTLVQGTQTLDPGVYCGGLTVSGDTIAILNPGIYIMDDGPLDVIDNATLRGENVGFYFTGGSSNLKFDKDSTINLTAPKTGEMAGLLLFEDPAVDLGHQFIISSNNARNLLGTIYLRHAELTVNASSTVADISAYTVIIVRRLKMYGGPNLVLNTGYSQTDIPVPTGAGPTGGVMISK